MDSSTKTHKPCIIVGGGVGGLIQVAELLRKKVFSIQEIQIFERNHDYGGVWKAATYPGAACDVFSCTYQISWHRNPGRLACVMSSSRVLETDWWFVRLDWDSLFPTGAELIRYYQNFAAHYNLPACTSFGQKVVQASWSEERSLWVVDVEDISSGEVTSWTCSLLVQAAGTYNRKNVPTIPGLDRFKGEVWHTADWPQQYDFTGKTVAYVGTGPTFVQVLPHLQQQASSLHVFCRSLTYCHPFTNFKYPAVVKGAFRRIPGLLALYSHIVAWTFGFWAYLVFRPETWLAKHTERSCRRHLAKEVSDTALLEKLKPPGRFGSKRPLVSLSDFFKTLQEKNVSLINDPIVSIDEHGLITSTKTRSDEIKPVDDASTPMTTDSPASMADGTTHTQANVLLLGTGFIMQGWGGAIPTTGRNGLLLSHHWADYPVSLYGKDPATGFPPHPIVSHITSPTPRPRRN